MQLGFTLELGDSQDSEGISGPLQSQEMDMYTPRKPVVVTSAVCARIIQLFPRRPLPMRYRAQSPSVIAGIARRRSRRRNHNRNRSHRLKKLRNILDKMRRCYLLALCPLLPPPLTDAHSQRYSTTALAAVHLISLIVWASAAASSCFEGWGGAALADISSHVLFSFAPSQYKGGKGEFTSEHIGGLG